MGDLSESQKESFPAYHPKCYLDIQGFIDKWKDFYYKPNRSKIFLQATPKSINMYLELQGFLEILFEMRIASPSPHTFYKKFFHWFNGFRVFKYIHFARDHFHRSIEIEEAATWLMTNYYHLKLPDHNAKTLLLELRKIDRMKEFTAN